MTRIWKLQEFGWFLLLALCVAPRWSEAQIRWRVSVKIILDENGNRPVGPLSSDAGIQADIDLGNALLAEFGRGFQLETLPIEEVEGAENWFDTNARSFINKNALEVTVRLSPDQYHYRSDAINIYINNSPSSGWCSRPATDLAGEIIFLGQGASRETLIHEIGHFFNLCHTQGCLCAGCDADDIPVIEGIWRACDVTPGDDEVDDTLPDIECWDQDDIAQNSFGRDYAQLTVGQQGQVDAVWFNLMSYHADRFVLTPGQLDRMSDGATWLRPQVTTGRTVFVDEGASGVSADGSSQAAVFLNVIQTGPYKKLDNAIDAADAGDIVMLRPGNYTESREIRKRITLRASRGDATLRAE